MKTQLTKEESARLISLGVPKEKASERNQVETQILRGYSYTWEYIFTLTDLLEILPKEIGHHSCISISWNFITEKWDVDYDYTQGSWHGSKELIDSLYELCVWCLENGYLKF